ncbi:3747_t:CDS:2, partial [Racocetra fulgida]
MATTATNSAPMENSMRKPVPAELIGKLVFISSVLVASKYVDDAPITARKMFESVGKDIWSIKDIIRM